jgi:uncharacterized membrane protein YqiK
VLLVGWILVRYSRLFVYIPNDSYGVVERMFSRKGSVRGGLIALDGRVGFQPDVLRGGPHFFLPFLYRVHIEKLITVRTIAYVFARDGELLPPGQTLARTPEHVSFEDVRGFLASGGQRGPQRAVLREGTYAINTAQFVVISDDTTYAIDIGDDKKALNTLRQTIEERKGFVPIVIEEDMLGVVTVHDGPSLEPGDLIAPIVGTDQTDELRFHNSFQDAESFLQAGGRRGRQEQVLVEGTYFINRLFATVEIQPKFVIPVGSAGVVISYTGAHGDDVSGDDYRHGRLVAEGYRGVWSTPLGPRKYALNPYAVEVKEVPTTNFVLRWIKERVEGHGYDSGLSEIPMITKDAYEPILPLSVVVHIDPLMAPRVIQRFSDIKLLVEQTLDPMVSAYFKDAAQQKTLLELISQRAELQQEAKAKMKARFAEYDLDLQEVMIGTPRAAAGDQRIPAVLDQLRARQLAVEQALTYEAQQAAAAKEKELNQAKSAASKQTELTASEIQRQIALNEGEAKLNMQRKEAEAIEALGNAEAAKIRAIGLANAAATKAQVDAYQGEGAAYQFRRDLGERFADAIANTKQSLVPTIAFNGSGGESGSHNVVEAMLAMIIQQNLTKEPAKS